MTAAERRRISGKRIISPRGDDGFTEDDADETDVFVEGCDNRDDDGIAEDKATRRWLRRRPPEG